MKATIWKCKEGIRYALLNFDIKVDQGCNLVIINPKFVKRLKHKVRRTSTFVNYRLGMSVRNGDSTKSKSCIKFYVEIVEIQ